MSDSPNRAVDFGAGVIVGILLAVGIGGAYTFTHLRHERMRAAEAEMIAREEAERAREEAEHARAKTIAALEESRTAQAEAKRPAQAPEMPPAKDPE
jgi:hypothetical protein